MQRFYKGSSPLQVLSGGKNPYKDKKEISAAATFQQPYNPRIYDEHFRSLQSAKTARLDWRRYSEKGLWCRYMRCEA